MRDLVLTVAFLVLLLAAAVHAQSWGTVTIRGFVSTGPGKPVECLGARCSPCWVQTDGGVFGRIRTDGGGETVACP